MATLLDPYGRPVRKTELRREVAAPTMGGARSPITGYPGDGLNPVRLATILKEADAGDPIRYLELAEVIEERDLHYLGVLGTRKRSVSQIDITVKPGGDSETDAELARMVEDWLDRDELTDELFNILDAIGKGYSFTEIIWDTSMGQWVPERLEYRDPRWFRFNRHDLSTPMMLDEYGQEVALPAFKFIHARLQAKSGLALRSGLARTALWAYLFKMYTLRDWAIFTQTYGQPLRIGKFGSGASEEDKATLFRAVANIAGDMAAIIPESMEIDFKEAANLGSGHQNYRERADWFDKQISKAVLGQTSTTDAETGGLGSGKEHREVQEDIERADAKALGGIINRDLIRPWVILERGEQLRYPRVVIARPEQEDLQTFAEATSKLVQVGLRVGQRDVRSKLGMPEPGDEEEILQPPGQSGPSGAQGAEPGGRTSPVKRFSGPVKRYDGFPGPEGPDAPSMQSEGPHSETDPVAEIVDRLMEDMNPAMKTMLDRVEAMFKAAGSMEELREMLLSGFPDLDARELDAVMAGGIASALAVGRVAVAEDSADG
jgi:phage gp29-like protein